MKHEPIDPIGVSAIDLLVCAFIAMVVLNILRQEDDSPSSDDQEQTPQMFILDTSTDCPLKYGLQIGSRQWWPGSNEFHVLYLEDKQGTHITRQLILRLRPGSGKVTLLVYATPSLSPADVAWPIRLSYTGKEGAGRSAMTALRADNGFRLSYPAP